MRVEGSAFHRKEPEPRGRKPAGPTLTPVVLAVRKDRLYYGLSAFRGVR
jgi:hypothetical protein